MKTKPQLIVCDVDDVIVNFKEVAFQALKKDFGLTKSPEKWKDHNLERTLGIENNQILESFNRHECLIQCAVNEGVKHFFDNAVANNYHIIALTARGWHPEGESLTNQYFKDNQLPVTRTIAIPLHESKGDQIAKLQNDYDVVMFFDDHPRHVTEVFERSDLVVDDVFIKTQPWNERFHLEGVKRLQTFKDLAELI